MLRLVALLAITAAANVVDDETSLIQIQKALTPGGDRPQQAPQDSAQDLSSTDSSMVTFEAFTLGDSASLAIPDGCFDRGCIGSGPDCGGNEFDCTSIGLVVTGYYKACSVTDTCQTGWKVRCAACGATTVTAVTYPDPAVLPATWQAPYEVPATPAPMAAQAAAVLPTQVGWRPSYPAVQDVYAIDFSKAGRWGGTCLCPDGITYGVGDSYDGCATFSSTTNCLGGTIVGKCNKRGEAVSAIGGWSGGSVVCANPDTNTPLNLLIKALNNATATHKKVEANITQFRQSEEKADAKARRHRKNAVSFAKKVALANVTIFKATKAMADAYFSQKGASEAAQTTLGDRKNANAHVRYYEKTLVDKKQATRDAQAALELGKAAVAKASQTWLSQKMLRSNTASCSSNLISAKQLTHAAM
jgi:hypothetical protein